MIWSYAYVPQIWPAILTVVLTAILGWYGWQRRNFPGARPFVFLCLFAFLWSVGCVLELSAADFSTKIFWIKFQGIWQLPEATTWPWFVLEYAGLSRWLTRRNLWLMFIPSILSFLIIVTNDYHHLLWKDFLMGDHVIQVFGIANWFLIGYSIIPILVTVIVLVWLSTRSPRLRWPAIIMLLGMVIAFGIYWMVNLDTGFLGPGERILFTMGILSLSFSVALFRFRALDPVPLAYSAIIKQMQSGVLVLDSQNRVVDFNPAAGQILGNSVQTLRGRPAAEVLPAELNILDWLEKPEMTTSEIRLGNGAGTSYYNLRFTPLKDRRDRPLGHLLLLHDVTEQKQAQEQILVNKQLTATLQERERLARELHDSIAQTLGYVNIEVQTIRKLVRDKKTEDADMQFSKLLEVVRDSHQDVRESILSLRSKPQENWSFISSLKQHLIDFQSHHGIHTELVLQDGLTDSTFEPEAGFQLLRVIQEALTNARKHGRAQTIKVTLELPGRRAIIAVTDDGVGFDSGHGNAENRGHFGLGFMRERMEQIGGSIRIDSRPGAGTVVTLEAPIRSQEGNKS
jgi:PAS domain S-box-containing protein